MAEAANGERLFPTLTQEQIARIAAHGRRRRLTKGELLTEVGDRAPFFVVVSGALDIVTPLPDGERLIVTHPPGHFTGEANMITGRPSVVRARMREDGELIEVDRSELLSLIQTDAELRTILMPALSRR